MKRKNTKGTLVFRAVYLTLTFLLTALILAALCILWNGLKAYEKSDPELPMYALMEKLNKDKSSFINNLSTSVNEFEDKKVLNAYLDALTAGELLYRRNGKKSTDEKVIYNILSGNGVIAEAEVIKSDKDLGYGFYEYELGGVTFGEVPTHGYTITAPDCVRVYCNGIMVSSSYITSEGEIYSETEHFQGLLSSPPKDVTYAIGGFIGDAEFTAYDTAGNLIDLKEGRFSLAQLPNEELSRLALDFAEAYSKYVVNDGYLSTVADYLAPNMPFYSELEGFENFWHNWHSDYDFLNVEVSDPVFYDEICASVKVRYDHVLYGVSSAENGEVRSEADYTVYLVNMNGLWKVVDLVFN